MLIKNEHYNPHWEAIHDFHHENRTRLEKEIKNWYQSCHLKNEDKYSDLENLKTEHKFHHNICADCLHRHQHEYVAELAIYLFQNSSSEFDETFFPPPEGFKTVDDVMKAWGRLNKMEN